MSIMKKLKNASNVLKEAKSSKTSKNIQFLINLQGKLLAAIYVHILVRYLIPLPIRVSVQENGKQQVIPVYLQLKKLKLLNL